MESNKNNVKKQKDRKFILYILIVIFIFSLGTLVYRVGNDIYAKREAERKEERLKQEQIEKEKQELKNKIKEEEEKINKEMEEQSIKAKIDSFNHSYEFWSGTQTNSIVSKLIDDAIKSNQKDKEHQIEFVFDGNSYGTEANSIRSIKNSLKDFNNYKIQYYEVILSYDNDGYVNKVTIETR